MIQIDELQVKNTKYFESPLNFESFKEKISEKDIGINFLK